MRDIFEKHYRIPGWFDETLYPAGWLDDDFYGQRQLTLLAIEEADTLVFHLTNISGGLVLFATEEPDTALFNVTVTPPGLVIVTLDATEEPDTAEFFVTVEAAPVRITSTGAVGVRLEKRKPRVRRAYLLAVEQPDKVLFRLTVLRPLFIQPAEVPVVPPLPAPVRYRSPTRILGPVVVQAAKLGLALAMQEEPDLARLGGTSVNAVDVDDAEFFMMQGKTLCE